MKNLHEMGFIHQDIKPDNILAKYRILKKKRSYVQYTKRPNLLNDIYLIDFGNVEKYKLDNGEVRPQESLNLVIGRKDYMSVNALDFKTQSRRDDLHSLVYTLINLRCGMHLNYNQKKKLSPLDLCVFGNLPGFDQVFQEMLCLGYKDEPNYNKIVFLFEKILLD